MWMNISAQRGRKLVHDIEGTSVGDEERRLVHNVEGTLVHDVEGISVTDEEH